MTFARFGHRYPSGAACEYSLKMLSLLNLIWNSLADLYLIG
jgi:hypothetical protein